MAFLITTADQRFWKKDEEIIFLGEWCKRFQDRSDWEKLNYKVLPYHWEDRTRLEKDITFIDNTYEKYLNALSQSLNKLHGVTYSQKYWRILIGIWLRVIIDSTYDRYLSIKTAQASEKVTNTWIGDTTPTYPKKNISVAWDDYNQYIFDRIITIIKPFPYEKKSFSRKPIDESPQNFTKQPLLHRVIKEIIRQIKKGPATFIRQGLAVLLVEYYPKLASKITHDIVFTGSLYINPLDQMRLQLSIGQVPYLFHGKKHYIHGSKPNQTLRGQLNLPTPENEFETILNALIPDEIPMLYVEDYMPMHEYALSISPKKPKAIVTAYTINYRDIFHLWAAYCVEKYGTKLLFSQHGGGLGIGKNISLDSHFLKIFDRYYSWGSTLGNSPCVKTMPSFRLLNLHKILQKTDYAHEGQILMMATTMPRYKIFADSGIAGPHMLNYFSEQAEFFNNLDKKPRDLLVWRYFNDKLWDDKARINAMAPDIKTQHGLKKQLGKASDFISEIKRTRLAIHTANETTYLETLAANFPTIVFWNPKYYEIRAELTPYFEALLDAGILFYNAKEAARQVNLIWEDPKTWWETEKVQKARQYFCDNLAVIKDDCLTQWQSELKNMLTTQNEDVLNT